MVRFILLFLLVEINTNLGVDGARCAKSTIGFTYCNPCGEGTRCHSCNWCTGHCVNVHTQGKRKKRDTGLVEAPYKIPFLEMFNDIEALLKVDEISDRFVVDLFKEASIVTREDCTVCNNSTELNNLSLFTDNVHVELEELVGKELFKPTAIEKTAETKVIVQNLPESLKIRVEPTSNILPLINRVEEVLSLEDDKQLGFIPQWGPDFTIKLEIYIKSFKASEYSDVLHLTATDKTCCDAGDRIPGVFLNNQAKRILVSMWGNWPSSGGIGNIYYTSGIVDELRWYAVEIKQENGTFTVKLDGNLVFQSQNNSPDMFNNVRVFTVHGNHPADALLRNFEYFRINILY